MVQGIGGAPRLHEGDLRGQIVTEIGAVLAYFLEGPEHLVGGGVLQHVAGRADFERAADDDRIRMHGEQATIVLGQLLTVPAPNGRGTGQVARLPKARMPATGTMNPMVTAAMVSAARLA